MTQDITSLIEKLEEASEGSVELSCDIGISLGEWTPPKGAERDIYTPDIWRRNGLKYYQPYSEVTTSLDAALALAGRVLPGWRMHALQDQQGIYQTNNAATRWAAGISEMRGAGNVLSYAPTPALAVCASILKARAQSEAR